MQECFQFDLKVIKVGLATAGEANVYANVKKRKHEQEWP